MRSLGAVAIAAAANARFDALVRFARSHSPFYREAWAPLPDGPLKLAELPVVTKRALMTSFDDWCTDRSVTRAAIDGFLAQRSHIGERFLGRYIVWTSSGSTGEPGIFVQDGRRARSLRRAGQRAARRPGIRRAATGRPSPRKAAARH